MSQPSRFSNRSSFAILIGVGVAAIVISILAGVLGRGTGQDNCSCISKNDAGYRAFSIAWLIMSIILIVLIMVWAVRGSLGKATGQFPRYGVN
jgi:hypothetical protein